MKTFKQFLNESKDRSKKNRFLGIFPPGKDVFQRIIKNVDKSSIEKLVKYTQSNNDEIDKIGDNIWAITVDSGKDNQAVWKYDEGILYFENPYYPSIYDTYIRKSIK